MKTAYSCGILERHPGKNRIGGKNVIDSRSTETLNAEYKNFHLNQQRVRGESDALRIKHSKPNFVDFKYVETVSRSED